MSGNILGVGITTCGFMEGLAAPQDRVQAFYFRALVQEARKRRDGEAP